ncbi:MAG: SdpI family protein [Clostridia bacterium]|nr:SdpI family protein [Clostridia bacterium]
MGFWAFMVISCLLIPVIMLIFGKLFSKTAPKKINYIFGYRTSRSMKNEQTWEFAHRQLGKIWERFSIALLPISVLPLIFVIGRSEDAIGTVGAIICFFQIAVIFVSIIIVETLLKRNFDENGNKI